MTEQGMPVILVVDDQPENLDVLSRLLEPSYRVLAARSGEQALRVAASVPRPDLMLLDVMMPDMDGYAVLEHLREKSSTRDIPVIFVTALDAQKYEERGFGLGAVDYVAKPIKPAILLARVHAQLELKQARDRLDKKVRFLTDHDPLTQMSNRLDFRERVLGAMARARRDARLVGVMLVDIDDFRVVNANYGDTVGDALLREFANRLKANLRAGDTLARVGANEFAFILEGLTERDLAAVAAKRALGVIEQPFQIDGREITVSASIGIAAYPNDGEELDALLHAVDVAKEAAQAGGGAGFRFYFPELDALVKEAGLACAETLKRIETLTEREREVLDMLVAGQSNKGIAYLLGASPRTVETHRARVMRKMAAESFADLVRMVLAAQRVHGMSSA